MEGTDKKVTGNTAVGAAECRIFAARAVEANKAIIGIEAEECRVFDAKVWANVVVISRGAEVKAETAGVFAVEV